ncbi:DYH14 protein, partial [Nycticryphes semicollaris]|nr:DYH14 protein [Nycticryphes semicollaris]
DEEYLPQMDEQNKMLKEKLVSSLRFEPERTEVLLMLKGRDIACDPADSGEKDNSKLSSPLEKKYSTLRTAVYRGRTERKHTTTIKKEDVCSGNELSRIHKEGREDPVCQPSSMSEQETVKLKRSMTKPTSLMLENENLKKTFATASAYNISKTEMQKALLEPSSHKKICEQPKMERSSKKSLRSKVHIYDKTKPIDDDVITHILRLRGKLGWQTTLTSCEQLAQEADVSRLQKFTLTRPLLLKDTGEYIYCLQRNRNNFKVPYNPYDLQAVSTNTAMRNKVYWTVTASFVSKFPAGRNLGEMEITPVPQWLYERQMYYKLLSFNFFSNFR